MSWTHIWPDRSRLKMPAPPSTVKPASGHTTKLTHGKSSNSSNTLCNSIAHLSDSRTNLTVNTPTTCQRLSEMFRRSIASSTQSSSRENTYEEASSSIWRAQERSGRCLMELHSIQVYRVPLPTGSKTSAWAISGSFR
nr:uncharacterized protein LOC118876812 [Drosophila suzukii]